MLIQLETQSSKPRPRRVFYSYSHKDEAMRDELDTHLKALKREGFISTWHDRRLQPGNDWDHVINENLENAEVILFLVSPNFLNSDYCRDTEVRRAMNRYERREALVIPIILKPCVWTTESFAKLQALPKNCRPLVEWPDSGFASVAEELRTMFVDLIYPRKPSEENLGQHGQWIMKLHGQTDVDDRFRAEQVVDQLQELTSDYSINLLATAKTQVAGEDKLDLGLMLILTGTPEAFTTISLAQDEGSLSTRLGQDVLSFYAAYGATVQGSSSPEETAAAIRIAETDSLVVHPGRRIDTPSLVGLVFGKAGADDLGVNFIIDQGDEPSDDPSVRLEETQKLTDYFYTSLVIQNELQWVNLSAYEADRMLPKELSGTLLGRNMLAQDCMLKRMTASLMHPDNPTGRQYWDAVYRESRRRFRTSKMPFRSFRKVWVKATEANIYFTSKEQHPSPGEDDDPFYQMLRPYPDGSQFAFLVGHELGVECEEDLVAARCSGETRTSNANDDFQLRLFREIVLPTLHAEVNEGEHFAEMRKIYSAEILATFVKKSKDELKNQKLRSLINSGDLRNRLIVRTVTAFGEEQTNGDGPQAISRPPLVVPIDHAMPNAPAFRIPENVEFYSQYVRLYKEGVFRCARSEDGDELGERVNRVYFSGAIDFTSIPVHVHHSMR